MRKAELLAQEILEQWPANELDETGKRFLSSQIAAAIREAVYSTTAHREVTNAKNNLNDAR